MGERGVVDTKLYDTNKLSICVCHNINTLIQENNLFIIQIAFRVHLNGVKRNVIKIFTLNIIIMFPLFCKILCDTQLKDPHTFAVSYRQVWGTRRPTLCFHTSM